ncbi:MAG: hypothetical protein AB7I42_25010 [Bradyrhizobium sp.]|uniref:hypothetical protein n=1 Tax=Bradyrhizobium sp. TaxID=376 RepID=UPI003D0F5E34
MTLWFRYERDHARRWCPVVVYGDKPVVPKRESDRITAAVAVPASCIKPDGEPSFGRLMAMFPPPKEST